MYCENCKKEVVQSGNMCPYCGRLFTQEQIDFEKEAQSQAAEQMTVEKSKATALILNYIFCGVGGTAYLGFKKLAKERVKGWITSFLFCLTIIGVFFAIPRLCKLIFAPFTDMKNIFSDKVVLINDKGERIIWK